MLGTKGGPSTHHLYLSSYTYTLPGDPMREATGELRVEALVGPEMAVASQMEEPTTPQLMPPAAERGSSPVTVFAAPPDIGREIRRRKKGLKRESKKK